MASGRWNYMGAPGFNPPTEACPQCAAPSRTWHVGARTVDGQVIRRHRCEHGHAWVQVEERPEPGEPPPR
jgi:hypothetical protein